MKTKLFSTLIVAALMITAVLTALPMGSAQAGPQAAPQSALKNIKYALLYSGNGITESKTGSAVYTGGYASADCYSVVDVTSAQTVTAIISHSMDASNWVTWNSYTAASADGTSFTTTVPYGTYMRASASLAGSNAVTVTIRCVLKD